MSKREFIEHAALVYVGAYSRGQIRRDDGSTLTEWAARNASLLWEELGKYAAPEPGRGPLPVRVVRDGLGDLFR